MKNSLFIIISLVCSFLPVCGQEHQWNEPLFINVNLGGSIRYDMEIDNDGNTYLIALFEDEVTILDTTLYTTKDDGVFLAKFDANHSLLWAKVIAEAKGVTPNIDRVLGRLAIEIDNVINDIYISIGYGDSILLENQMFIVDQSQTYYQDIIILKCQKRDKQKIYITLRGVAKV